MKRLKVLISAYACRPNMGSEPGVGWNMVREVSKYHDVLVLTRADNRPSIESELAKHAIHEVQFVFCDLPGVGIWKRGLVLVHLHYYLWQIIAYFTAKALHKQSPFDLAHHVTYVRHSSPSFLALLPVPFIWGPVGGGESAPKTFWKDFGWRGQIYENLRGLMRRLGEGDPFVALTARRSAIANATTADTARQLKQLGANKIKVVSQVGISTSELEQLAQLNSDSHQTLRFVSIGRLLHWKGFHLGLRAFAKADLPPSAEYWIIGTGTERQRLQHLAKILGVAERVYFLGNLSRTEVLKKLNECFALVHPSLHESGGFVCLEAMAIGKPVLCLDLGGPAIQVTEETGFKIPAKTPEQVVADLVVAMTCLSKDISLAKNLGQEGQRRAQENFSWESKGERIHQMYQEVYRPELAIHPDKPDKGTFK